jgi:hypothetical protein
MVNRELFELPNVLVAFSNPADSLRLRLDREQRAIDEVQKKHQTTGHFNILPAATVEDLIQSLRQPFIRIVHFSGHGSPHGVYLETSATSDTGVELKAEKLTELILSHAPRIEALILASCYSADSSAVLRHAAPYVITVEGEADDEAAIMFTKTFYDNFLGGGSVEGSLARTQITLQSMDYDAGLQIYVTRRGETLAKDRITLQSIKRDFSQETLLVDVTDMPKGKFLALLANKISVHKWLPFSSFEMDYAVFPIGKYFAVFSWKHGMDVLVCKRILTPKEEATDKQCSLWMRLSFRYSQLFSLRYRRERQAVYAGMRQQLEFALDDFRSCLSDFFQNEASLNELRYLLPNQIKMAAPLIAENYSAAERHFHQDDYPQTIVHLETMLSLIHGILDGLVDALAV